MLEDNPLKAKPRKRRGEKSIPPPNETPEEKAVRLMEEEFPVFDWTRIDRAAAEKALAEAEIIDLCEKEGYKPTLEVEKPNQLSSGVGGQGNSMSGGQASMDETGQQQEMHQTQQVL